MFGKEYFIPFVLFAEVLQNIYSCYTILIRDVYLDMRKRNSEKCCEQLAQDSIKG